MGSNRNRDVQVSWLVAPLGGWSASWTMVPATGSYSQTFRFFEKKSRPVMLPD